MKNWEIIDDEGVIHSGTEEEMNLIFICMTKDISYLMANDYAKTRLKAAQLQEIYYMSWNGDLKLIEVHNIEK